MEGGRCRVARFQFHLQSLHAHQQLPSAMSREWTRPAERSHIASLLTYRCLTVHLQIVAEFLAPPSITAHMDVSRLFHIKPAAGLDDEREMAG